MNLKNVKTATWVRVIALFLVLINQIATSFFDFKLLPFADEEIYDGVSVVVTALVAVIGAWYNNSITTEAQIADNELRKMKGDK